MSKLKFQIAVHTENLSSQWWRRDWCFLELQRTLSRQRKTTKNPVVVNGRRCNPLSATKEDRSSNVSTREFFVPFMNSVRNVIKKTLPRYNLRSRKLDIPEVRSSTPKVNRATQADLSDEEHCTLFLELPFCTSTIEVSPPPAIGASSSEQVQPENPQPQLSTAYSNTDQANRTNREAVDISIDSISERHEPPIVHSPRGQPDKSDEVSLEDIQPIHPSQVQSGPHIALEVENVSDPDTGDRQQTTGISTAERNIPVINSPADLYTLVKTSINYKKSKPNFKQKKTRTRLDYSSSSESEGSSEETEESEPD
ncbi:hypothetical protein OS493_035445 [Desmophyllum pertusum]|uniref:Uncharacterized protein n=1 Tax=Desmophyllum pertusum TaxID=174260 RepID=A0A9X0CUQ8_9CNID|nr:hypothetical protein OS493_035445 [Desmophyllum pertusum]